MYRYVHTNIIAKDAAKLIEFYKEVFQCTSIGETRDLRGEWLDKITNLKNAHITGEHLLLPGYHEDHPTLEIFSYDDMKKGIQSEINRPGIAHIAFEVDDVEETLAKVIAFGGKAYGELIKTEYPNHMEATFVYTQDPEGNIIELQSWRKIK